MRDLSNYTVVTKDLKLFLLSLIKKYTTQQFQET